MAKKNNPQDEQIEEMLHKVLGRYQEILFKAANAKKDEDVYAYKERFIKAIQDGAYGFKKQAQKIVNDYIPNFEMPVSTLLQSFGARYGGEEIKLTTYVRMVEALTLSADQYRIKIDEQIRERERNGNVTTVMDLKDIINQDLRDDNVTVVRYANGTSVPVDKYASMLARTTRAETENLSMIQQALREGIDLVECDVVSPTCDSCAVYQGRVYSISGNDSRYPALYKTAFKSGYSIIHPNCRHSWSPYHAELYSEEERRHALERSNRTWKPDGDGRVFQQTERARAEYAHGQQLMRQWNAEIVEYERMKAYYKSNGKEPPYKTLGAFRREARKPREKQSQIMRQWRNRDRDSEEYKKIKSTLGANKVPETFDKFKDIKYNKNNEQYDRLKLSFNDAKIRERIGSDEFPLKVHEDRQGKHISTAKTFDKTKNKSFLSVCNNKKALEFSQKIIDKYHGKGELQHDIRNEWKHTELIEANEIIGFVEDIDGVLRETNRAIIHYSKTGTHIVPTLRSFNHERK